MQSSKHGIKVPRLIRKQHIAVSIGALKDVGQPVITLTEDARDKRKIYDYLRQNERRFLGCHSLSPTI